MSEERKSRISGWGRYPVVETEMTAPRSVAGIVEAMTADDGVVARGNGRAYGDAAAGAQHTLDMRGLDRLRGFNEANATVTVEAGLLLSELIAASLPRGLFPAVVPGTRFVTIGGAIAANVHGKNHHRDGAFGDHVETLRLATSSGEVLTLSRAENSDLFAATLGGMGLTGTIIEATLRLRRVETGWIRQRTIIAPNLADAIAALDAGDEATYSVAWIDCLAKGTALGRSLIFLGEHADASEVADGNRPLFPAIRPPRLSVPLDMPSFTLNRLSVSAFNELYFRTGARRAGGSFLVPADPYFFPLDGIDAWNRIYGRRGFVQHQCVLPTETAPAALAEMLGRISRRGDASFLAVLKKFGAGQGFLSFPMPGYTLALDFAVSDDVLDFLDELDALVVAAGGRLYLAKDARQSRATFEAGYPELGRFREVRREVDPLARIRSHQSVRLGI